MDNQEKDIEKVLQSLLRKYKHRLERSRKKEESYEGKDLTCHGRWSLGYFGGRVMALEDIVDDIEDVLTILSNKKEESSVVN